MSSAPHSKALGKPLAAWPTSAPAAESEAGPTLLLPADHTPVQSEPLPSIADKRRYLIQQSIGTGGSAVVYRARDIRFNRDVALKRFTPETMTRSPENSDYLSEVDAISRVCHPHVVRAYDLDTDEEGPFLILELIPGINLEEQLKVRPLTVGEIRHFVVQTLEGLIAIHQTDLTHLDLKPANLMASATATGIPHYTIIDFGRACDPARAEKRRLSKGKKSLVGSLYYMAPEQLLNGAIDARTDLYALGAIIYELLTGKKAFEGEDSIQVMSAHLTHRVTPIHEILPQLPSGIAHWIMALIASKPDVRPTSAREALKSFLSLSQLEVLPLAAFPAIDKLQQTA